VVSSGGSLAGLARFRRIVVALDGQSADPTAMEQAVALAARMHGELMAVFVEDIDLVRLSQHGSISAFSTFGAARRDLPTDSLRDALRLQAARLRRAVEEAAARRQVKCVFQVCQGRLLAEVLRAATNDDLVVIGWPSGERTKPWTGTPPPPAVVAQALAEARARSVLLLHPRGATGGPVVVAFDDSEAAWHGLAVAAQVAEQDGGAINVVLLHGRPEQAEQAGTEIVRALAATRLTAELLHSPKAGLRTLTEIARGRHAALLVLGADRALAEADDSRRLLQRLDCSVLLVR
jgi:nucleotide-binding universal stress UspA family protein